MLHEFWPATEAVGYLFVAVLVGTLFALAFGRPRRRPVPPAEEILKKRYALGELTRQQYEDGLEALRR